MVGGRGKLYKEQACLHAGRSDLLSQRRLFNRRLGDQANSGKPKYKKRIALRRYDGTGDGRKMERLNLSSCCTIPRPDQQGQGSWSVGIATISIPRSLREAGRCDAMRFSLVNDSAGEIHKCVL